LDYTAFEDHALLQLVTREDTDALGELYNRYHRLIYSLAFTTVGDHPTAEEITLDVFTRVWQKARTYDRDRAKVSTWLTSIARYRAIDELRRRSARPEKRSLEWTQVPLDAVPRVDGPETTAQIALQRERVRAALNELPMEQREVLLLAYFKGYTQREIAQALDQPLGTVKTRTRLGMQKLRDMLQDEPIIV
jgi:RNA polymerase sigma-70 factor (ECF subfamily)